MRRCETTQDVRPAYSEALRAIKATDAIVVGMYNKEKGQVAANAELVKQVLAELA